MATAQLRRFVLAAAFVAAVLLFLYSLAHGHEALSGWRYPATCCENQHCHPVDCASIEERGGGYSWRGLFFTSSQTTLSGDGQCHACADWQGLTPITPRCLFLDHGS